VKRGTLRTGDEGDEEFHPGANQTGYPPNFCLKKKKKRRELKMKKAEKGATVGAM